MSGRRFNRLAVFLVFLVVVSVLSGCALMGKQSESGSEMTTFSKYGFAFDYPKKYRLVEEGILERDATEYSGMVSWGLNYGDYNEFTVTWVNVDTEQTLEDLKSTLDITFEELMADSSTANLVKGELRETTKGDGPMIHQQFSADFDGRKYTGVSGNWYSSKSKRFYLFLFAHASDNNPNPLPHYLKYVNSLRET